MDPVAFFEALLEQHGLNPHSLAQRLLDIGATTSNIQPNLFKWQDGQVQNPTRKTIKPVADYFDVDPEAFYDPVKAEAEARRHGIDPDSSLSDTGKPRLRVVGKGKDSVRDDIRIPEYKTGGSMGAGVVLRDQPGEIRSWTVSRQWVQLNVRAHSGTGNLCVVTGFGDSMRPLFNPGDPLLVDAGVKTVEFEGVYFFRVGDEGFI